MVFLITVRTLAVCALQVRLGSESVRLESISGIVLALYKFELSEYCDLEFTICVLEYQDICNTVIQRVALIAESQWATREVWKEYICVQFQILMEFAW